MNLTKQLPSSLYNLLQINTQLLLSLPFASSDTLLQSFLWQKQDIRLCQVQGHRLVPRQSVAPVRATTANQKHHRLGPRGKKAESARVKAAAGESGKRKATEVQEIPAEKNTEENDPVEIATKPPKQRVVPPPGKKRKQYGPKKAVVKGGKGTIEEIDDDSTYTRNEVDEEEDE
jgi:hypothetical protein